jgi:dTMP kinase
MPFVTFEGIEGSGKSTQARRLAAEVGQRLLLTHEPGATNLGQAIRAWLLDRSRTPVAPWTELLLFCADRAQHVDEVIRPALAHGQIVIADRFSDSTLAYQGYGRGLDLKTVRSLCQAAEQGLRPQLTLLFDLPVTTGLARAGRRGQADRMEAESIEFHERVRQGFLDLARQEADRFVVLDALASADEIAMRVREILSQRGWSGHGLR